MICQQSSQIIYFPVFDNDIPIVMLLIGGDFTTLTAIRKGLENGTPVVVVRVRIYISRTIFQKVKSNTK
jgi:NAD kinase